MQFPLVPLPDTLFQYESIVGLHQASAIVLGAIFGILALATILNASTKEDREDALIGFVLLAVSIVCSATGLYALLITLLISIIEVGKAVSKSIRLILKKE